MSEILFSKKQISKVLM